MKILHIDTGNGWRGGQQQAFWLMEGLRERGLEQALAAPKVSPLSERASKERLDVVALSSPANSLANARTIRRIAGQFDLLHAHDSHGHSLAWLAGIAKGNRFRPALVVSRRVAFPIGKLGAAKYRAAAAYIAVSDYVRQQLLKAKVPAGKIHVVNDGVKPPLSPATAKERTDFRRRFGLDDQTPLVGTLTSPAPEKLLQEQAQLLEDLPSVHLWIGSPSVETGQRGAEAALIQYAKQCGIEDRFRILPLSGDPGPFLGSLDVFVYLSKSEGLGSAILLAMAHGLPVVASRAGGIPEIVRHQETGLLVGENFQEELPAAVQRLLDSEGLRLQLGSAGRQFVLENATTEKMVSKTLAVYEEVLKGSADRKIATQRPSTGTSMLGWKT